MSSRFLIDGERIRQLAATRQGRVSLGGFAYQMGYAVARLASLYAHLPVLEIKGIPTLLRFDWAEDLDEVDNEGTVLCVSWLDSHLDHAQVHHILRPLVKASPGEEEIRALGRRWIRSYPNHPHVYLILEILVASGPSDSESRGLALSWLKSHAAHPQACHVLAPLVKIRQGDEEIRTLSMGWISSHYDAPNVHWFLASLIAANHDDSEMRRLAIEWIKSHSDHAQTHRLLSSLVRARPGDQMAWRCAIEWIRENPDRDYGKFVFGSLAAARPGDEELLRLAEYLAERRQSGRAGTIAFLLRAGQASPRYIDLALQYLTEYGGLGGRSILKALRKAMANNLPTALAYVVSCADKARKKIVLRSIAIGVQEQPEALESLLSGRIGSLSLGDCNALIVDLLDLGVRSEDLYRFVARRLAEHWRRSGYGFLLRALERNLDAQAGILAVSDLSPRVRRDLGVLGRSRPS